MSNRSVLAYKIVAGHSDGNGATLKMTRLSLELGYRGDTGPVWLPDPLQAAATGPPAASLGASSGDHQAVEVAR